MDVTDLKIDFVAPPFAGHLFPQLQLARYLKSQGFNNLRFFSCPRMKKYVEPFGIGFIPVLADKEADVLSLALTDTNVMGSWKMMKSVVAKTLELMPQMTNELWTEWQQNRPDLVIVDSFSPTAGFAAEDIGLRWWTASPISPALEARTGPPSFLGGMKPAKSIFGKMKNALARKFVRGFKKTIVFLFYKQIKTLGFKTLYRQDGSEGHFSGEVILAQGIREIEFETDYPPLVHWIGPCTESPVPDQPPIIFEKEKRHILITLGTQIPWARKRASQIFRQVAAECPDLVFHFAQGKISEYEGDFADHSCPNLTYYDFIPYTEEYLPHYDVIIDHGGCGIVYSAILSGVPQLVFPQDFDQYDYAARITYHGLGLQTNGKAKDIVTKLRTLLTDPVYHAKAVEFQRIAQRYQPGKAFLDLLQNLHNDRI